MGRPCGIEGGALQVGHTCTFGKSSSIECNDCICTLQEHLIAVKVSIFATMPGPMISK